MNSDLGSLSDSDEKFKKRIKSISKINSQISRSPLSKSPLGKSSIVSNRYNNPEIYYLGYIK